MSIINQFAVSLQDTVAFYKGRRQFQDLLRYIRRKAQHEKPLRNSIELNSYLDALIVDLAEQLRIKKLETVPVTEFQEEFTKKWLGMKFKGNFHGKNGHITNLSSIQRKENCCLVMLKEDGRIFSFTLGLKTAKLEFERYELNFGPINTNGRISIEARENAFNAKINVYLKKNSKVQRMEVTRAEVTKCGNFKISLTGFGNLGGNRIAKMVIKSLLNKHKNEMKAKFEKDLKVYLKQTIENYL